MRFIKFTILSGILALSGSAAFAADPVIPDDPMGLYIGAHAGYGWGDVDADGDDADIEGFVGGILAGWEHRGDGLVFGIEGDVGFASIDGQDFNAADLAYDLDFNAHLRGKVGFEAGGLTPFIAGGLALGKFTVTEQGGLVDDDKTLIGFTIGGGVDLALTENLTVRAEYLYDDYGSANFDVYSGVDVDFQVHTVRGAAIFNF